jgi:hypothetical protein
MSNQYTYTLEKLGVAIEQLATLPGDVRERLKEAFLVFHTLTDKDFPSNLKADWLWVMAELTKYGAVLDHKGVPMIGSVENTMKKIRKATGTKIAQKIYELYWAVKNT